MPTSTTSTAEDLGHMTAALGLARRGLGSVWPNPAVGCVLVNDGRVVGRGRTAPGGRPHAETEALSMAGERARGAVAYVTLEPCSHQGQTGPCAEALIRAGIRRAVVAIDDPDPRVSGRGLEMLRKVGVQVDLGLCREEAAEINAGFFRRVNEKRPLVILKSASSLDGRIATHSGESKWITGQEARTAGHMLRAEADAIMVGSTTAMIDDPDLTCRLTGLESRSPVRVVVDSHLRLPLTARVVATAKRVPTWLVTMKGNDPTRLSAYKTCGVEVVEAPPGEEEGVDLPAALQALGERGLTRILVEGGAHLSAALLRCDLVDRIAWFRAPLLIGGDGLPSAMPFGIDRLEQAPRFTRLSVAEFGGDIFEYLTRD